MATNEKCGPGRPIARRCGPRGGRSALAALAVGVLLGTSLPATPAAAAPSERPRGAVETILGGSFFPFRRSFAPPSPRCRALAARLKSRHNSGVLNVWDLQTLRRAGCGGAM